MKKLLLISMLLVLCVAPQITFAQTQITVNAKPTGGCKAGICTYVPLEPLPGVDQRGINFSAFVSGMFRLFITLGALFAVLMLVIAGITYMVASSPGQISSAKNRATAALYGLLLLTSCWLILYTINPNLLRFNLFDKQLDTYAQKSTSPGSPSNGAIQQIQTDQYQQTQTGQYQQTQTGQYQQTQTGQYQQTQPTESQLDACTGLRGMGRMTYSVNYGWICQYTGPY